MTKPVFIAAFSKARRRQNAFTGDKKYRDGIREMVDTLYDDFRDEDEADVVHALDVLGKSNEVINYANIRRGVDESRASRERGQRKPEPKPEGDLVPKAQVRGMLDKLFGKNWRGGETWNRREGEK